MSGLNLLGTQLTRVETTCIATLFYRYYAFAHGISALQDPMGLAIAQRLLKELRADNKDLFNILTPEKMCRKQISRIAIRASYFDQIVQDFISQHQGGTIVSLGCGLDTRFWRLDRGSFKFFDIDLPGVITLKRQLVTENENYRLLAASLASESSWPAQIIAESNPPYLFVSEGVFGYLSAKELELLIRNIAGSFPRAQLLCDTPLNKQLVAVKGFELWFKCKWPNLISFYDKYILPATRLFKNKANSCAITELFCILSERSFTPALDPDGEKYWLGIYQLF